MARPRRCGGRREPRRPVRSSRAARTATATRRPISPIHGVAACVFRHDPPSFTGSKIDPAGGAANREIARIASGIVPRDGGSRRHGEFRHRGGVPETRTRRLERTTIFLLAGLDPSRAVEYYEVQRMVDELSYAGNEAARRYINGDIGREPTVAWLENYALMPHERAEQRVRFFDQYRYIINYNYGNDLVRAFIESRGGTAAHPEK